MCIYSREFTHGYYRILSSRQTAEFLGVSPSKMQKLRCYGGGPEFIKLGRTVHYPMPHLIAWLESNRASSTAEYKLRKL